MRVCAPSLLCMLLVLFTFQTVDGYFGQMCMRCYYNEGISAVELTFSWYFNKAEHVRYNSMTNTFTGYTDFGKAKAALLNQDPQNSLYGYFYTLCKEASDRHAFNFQKTVRPEVILKSPQSESDLHLAILMCGAYDYYPKGARLSWLRNGKVVSEGVSYTEERSDGDWYYQTQTYIEYTPIPGENISCMVEHKSLTQPVIYTWDPPVSVDERNKLIIGIFLLVLGIVVAIAGFIYYMLRAKGNPMETALPSIRFVRTASVASSQASNP